MASIFFTEGEGTTQVAHAAADTKIRIYTSLAQLKNDIANLREGMIVATVEDEFKEDAFDEIDERLSALEKAVDDLMNSTGTGDGIAFTGTRAELETALQIPSGEDGYIPENALVLITDQTETAGEFV